MRASPSSASAARSALVSRTFRTASDSLFTVIWRLYANTCSLICRRRYLPLCFTMQFSSLKVNGVTRPTLSVASKFGLT